MNLVNIGKYNFWIKTCNLKLFKVKYLAFWMMFSNLWSEKNWNPEIYRSMRKTAVSPKTTQANLVIVLFHSVNAFKYERTVCYLKHNVAEVVCFSNQNCKEIPIGIFKEFHRNAYLLHQPCRIGIFWIQ